MAGCCGNSRRFTTLRIYDFSRGPKEIANIPGPSGATSEPTSRKSDTAVDDAVDLAPARSQAGGKRRPSWCLRSPTCCRICRVSDWRV